MSFLKTCRARRQVVTWGSMRMVLPRLNDRKSIKDGARGALFRACLIVLNPQPATTDRRCNATARRLP